MDETNKGFMKHLGGLQLKQISETQYEFIVEVKEIHLNTGKIAHGGFLSTIADTRLPHRSQNPVLSDNMKRFSASSKAGQGGDLLAFHCQS